MVKIVCGEVFYWVLIYFGFLEEFDYFIVLVESLLFFFFEVLWYIFNLVGFIKVREWFKEVGFGIFYYVF